MMIVWNWSFYWGFKPGWKILCRVRKHHCEPKLSNFNWNTYFKHIKKNIKILFKSPQVPNSDLITMGWWDINWLCYSSSGLMNVMLDKKAGFEFPKRPKFPNDITGTIGMKRQLIISCYCFKLERSAFFGWQSSWKSTPTINERSSVLSYYVQFVHICF